MVSGLRALSVLLADDNSHMRAIVGEILMGVGFERIHMAPDGAAALSILKDVPIDIAIIDFRMSPIDGVELTRTIRKGKTPFLPIIMMTGFGDRKRVFEARDAGITEMLAKPVTVRKVVDRLNAVIYKPRPFVSTGDYFGPLRRGIDDGLTIAAVPRPGQYARI